MQANFSAYTGHTSLPTSIVSSSESRPKDKYLLGEGSEDEARLKVQEAFLNPFSIEWVKECGIRAGDCVMDVGCGHGAFTVALAQYLDSDGKAGKVYAVDSSQKQLEIAQNAASRAGVTNITWICCDVYNLRSLDLDEPCDVVHCRWLLAHLKKPLLAIEAMKTKLRTGGKLLIEEPGGDIYHWTPREPWAFTLWKIAVKVQHWLQGSSREVALELLQQLPETGLSVRHRIPEIFNKTALEKSRFRLGIEKYIDKLPQLLQPMATYWTDCLRAIEQDDSYTLACRSFYQIVAVAPSI